MSLGVIDVREWQTMFDLRSGEKVDVDNPTIQMVKDLIRQHPYPGDVDPDNNAWVTDTALDLIERYEPAFVFLSYAYPYFTLRFQPTADSGRKSLVLQVFSEVERFLRLSGFEPVIVGSGNMTPLLGFTDLSALDGLATMSNWSTTYLGLFSPSDRDLRYIAGLPHIERMVSRKEFAGEFEADQESVSRLPDYIIVAEEGYTFKASGSSLRRVANIPARNRFIPVHSALGKPESITDIRSMIETNLKHRKVALIMVEGLGDADSPLPYTLCINGHNWYAYEPGEAQYLAVTTGEDQYYNFPPGYRYYLEDDEEREYPFSGYFNTLPENTLGRQFEGRSIAVGNRSMFMHVASGADISIECYARVLYNHGVMAVIR